MVVAGIVAVIVVDVAKVPVRDFTMLCVLLGIGIGVLADVNANVFVLAMSALDSPVPTLLEGFSR